MSKSFGITYEKASRFKDILAAMAEGKVVQFKSAVDFSWSDLMPSESLDFSYDADHYRVKVDPVITTKLAILYLEYDLIRVGGTYSCNVPDVTDPNMVCTVKFTLVDGKVVKKEII